jgi:branched-chain amino acid transport system ATP-binding protein
MLKVENLQAAYGASQVLFGIDIEVGAGEVVTLMGRNGMGKTTTISSIMGIMPKRGGRVTFAGEDITAAPSYRIARAGLGLVPEGRQVFPNLTTHENLYATASKGADKGTSQGAPQWTLERIYAMFPKLRERRNSMGNLLSGGEQQMLAIGRALLTNPKLLILDEATEGLAPLIRAEIWQCLADLKRAGQAILVIDKNVDALAAIADHHFIIEKGKIVWDGTSAALTADVDLQHRYLGV